MPEMTICINCKINKSVEDFYPTNKSRCKSCCSLLSREWVLKNKFNISSKEFTQLSLEQADVCAICRQPQAGKWSNKLYIDHCHQTNKIRGLLCDDCNVGLGRFKDNPIALINAALYIS